MRYRATIFAYILHYTERCCLTWVEQLVFLTFCFMHKFACKMSSLFLASIWNNSSAVAEMGDRLATTDMSREVDCGGGGLLCPFPWGKMGPHLTECRLGRGIHPYQVARHLDLSNRFATIWQRYRQDSGTGQRGQWSRSIGRTVTCNGSPKTACYHFFNNSTRAAARVLEYSSNSWVVNYSSNFLLLEYSLMSIFGCKFPFPVAVFAVNWRIDGI